MSRSRFHGAVISPNGRTQKELTMEQAIDGYVWAWWTMPQIPFMWAWTAVGYVEREEILAMNAGVAEEEWDANLKVRFACESIK